MSPESPQDMHKTFINEMRQPMLRQGYIPIPVCHENPEPRLQQYPSFSYIHPAVQQNLRTDGRTPSPTPAAHCRPRSPVQTPSEAYSSCSPTSHGPEVRSGESRLLDMADLGLLGKVCNKRIVHTKNLLLIYLPLGHLRQWFPILVVETPRFTHFVCLLYLCDSGGQ